MKKAKITKIEKQPDMDFFSVTLDTAGHSIGDFDLMQLGGSSEAWKEPKIINTGDWVTGATVELEGLALKIGDCITDEDGGDPIIAACANGNVEEKNMSQDFDGWKRAFEEKHGLKEGSL